MQGTIQDRHWLADYAGDFRWHEAHVNSTTTYHRRLGLVELAFDADGRYNEGRADINALLELNIRTRLSRDELHRRILLAWTTLRCQHVLLQARAVTHSEIVEGSQGWHSDVCFAIDMPKTTQEAVQDAKEHIIFMDRHYSIVDTQDFWTHSQNVARIIDPKSALARLFVFPLEATDNGTFNLRLLIVGSHQIWDGLTTFVWLRDLVHCLNKSEDDLEAQVATLLDRGNIRNRLPLPQEALYPPISGSPARQRWHWLITRILRHVRRPLRAGFANPLRRTMPLKPVAHSPTYAAVLDYSKIPPLNSFPLFATLAPRPTQRLHRLCREAKASIGAGCFALAALVMMEMYEAQTPLIPLSERKPFISGFPLNPRAFFNHRNDPDSLMLAFSDGISLPFLSADQDLDGRIRLLARQAHRQLASYQKRTNPAGEAAGLQYMSSRGAGRVLSNQYVSSVERSNALLPHNLRKDLNPQGVYPMRPNASTQTCGVSSVGRRDAFIRQGMYDLNDDTKDLVADFRDTRATVRPREGEFLVGIGSANSGLGVGVSIDASSMDPVLVQEWKDRLQLVLDEDVDGEKARL